MRKVEVFGITPSTCGPWHLFKPPGTTTDPQPVLTPKWHIKAATKFTISVAALDTSASDNGLIEAALWSSCGMTCLSEQTTQPYWAAATLLWGHGELSPHTLGL